MWLRRPPPWPLYLVEPGVSLRGEIEGPRDRQGFGVSSFMARVLQNQ